LSEQVLEFLKLLKRTLDGAPYISGRKSKVKTADYKIVDVADPFTGRRLGSGKYFVIEQVGSGAMSVVYKARQDPIDRIVAIKLLKKEWSNDPLTVRRFQREAKTVSKLRHANIPSIMDFGIADTGQPYFVTEFIEGASLEQILEEEGALAQERAARVFIQVCDAMSHAHRNGLIHRDLKPGNVMIVNDAGGESVKLVDFGIVKYAKSQAASQQLTQKGEIWGSPVYMSPEQCSGTELDARTDIYSLGTVMYEALTGKIAFEGKNIPIILTKQLNEMPPDFATAAPSAGISKKLEDVVFRALQKAPDKRYQSMEEFKLALDDALKDLDRARRKNSSSSVLNDSRTNSTATVGGAAPSQGKLPVTFGPGDYELPSESDHKIKYIVFALICVLLVGGGVAIGVLIGSRQPSSEVTIPGRR
jgi:eukaryotic-like serine/threonine-protein kinase